MSKFGMLKNEMIENDKKLAKIAEKYSVYGGGKVTKDDEFAFIIIKFSNIKDNENKTYTLTMDVYVADEYIEGSDSLKWCISGSGEMTFTDDTPVEMMMRAVFKNLESKMNGKVEYLGLLDSQDIGAFNNELEEYEASLNEDDEDEYIEDEDEDEDKDEDVKKISVECNIKMFN